MKIKIYKKETPQDAKTYVEIRTQAAELGFRYTNEKFWYMFFEKEYYEKKEKKFVWWQDYDTVKQELEDVIKYWNKIFKENRKTTPDLVKAYYTIREWYSNTDVETAFRNYIEAKEDAELQYRLTPIKFLKQKNNWLVSYL